MASVYATKSHVVIADDRHVAMVGDALGKQRQHVASLGRVTVRVAIAG